MEGWGTSFMASMKVVAMVDWFAAVSGSERFLRRFLRAVER
jgi:hypothetical protein